MGALVIALLIPFLGTTGGAACVLFMKKTLGRSVQRALTGFASGVTLGLSTTIGGILAPLVGWAADQWGLVAALQILWIAGLMGSVAAFTLKEPQ